MRKILIDHLGTLNLKSSLVSLINEIRRQSEGAQVTVNRAGKNVLLLISDPKDLFKALTELKNQEITLKLFKEKMEEILKKKISKKHAESYFYSATIFGFLLPQSQKGKYRLSATGHLLCSLYNDPTKKAEYQRILSTVLLTNRRKGELFKRFLDFVKDPKSVDEIYNKFGKVTGKSLIIWTIEAGLVFKCKNFIGKARLENFALPDLDEFWKELKMAYNQMQKTPIFGVKKIFVDIGELRLRVSCKFNFPDLKEFDKYLQALLDTKYGKFIFLHGAPSHILERRENDIFEYKNKSYLYLSIKEEVD